jgi:translation initiation factor IF-2
MTDLDHVLEAAATARRLASLMPTITLHSDTVIGELETRGWKIESRSTPGLSYRVATLIIHDGSLEVGRVAVIGDMRKGEQALQAEDISTLRALRARADLTAGERSALDKIIAK